MATTSRFYTAATVATAAAGAVALWYLNNRYRHGKRETDPGLIQKGTRYEAYTTPSHHTYPRIRTFYYEHPQIKTGKLPKDIPLLVFVHGLGGQITHFQNLLTTFVNIQPCLAIDFPGCGRSDFKPDEVEAYSTTALAELVYCAIDRFRDKSVDQKAILVGHSMGCSIAALLASSTSPLAYLCSDEILGMVALCPRSTSLTQDHLNKIWRLNWIWSPLFDLVRLFDRYGGIDSKSVLRVVGNDADYETRKLQLRFNQQSKSATFQKILLALHQQETTTAAQGEDSLLGRRTWGGIKVPLYLVAAQDDTLAPPKEIEQITEWLAPQSRNDSATEEEIAPDGSAPPSHATRTVVGDTHPALEQLSAYNIVGGNRLHEQRETKHRIVLKSTIFPSPASHAILYDNSQVRILAGLTGEFLAKYTDERLSQGWQLQHMTTTGKWDVKNLAKWQSVAPCSDPIAGVFRAMKTMRDIDEVHCPKVFLQKFSYKAVPDGVFMVVDISHDTPVYNPADLEEGGIEYHKFPTVSKLPPSEDEVEAFVGLIDQLRREEKLQPTEDGKKPTIGVHCHYGFNRTGYFIICYLVERLGYTLKAAMAEFAQKRAPGVKHNHFQNALYVRYEAKMERRGTIIGGA